MIAVGNWVSPVPPLRSVRAHYSTFQKSYIYDQTDVIVHYRFHAWVTRVVKRTQRTVKRSIEPRNFQCWYLRVGGSGGRTDQAVNGAA